jgi:RNA polymerase sigma-70 factor (ECF subfamily)
MIRIWSKNRSAFEQAVRDHSADLFRFAYWLCRDRALAEDLVQEAFLRAWRAWDELRDPRVVKSWLFTIVRNERIRMFSRSGPRCAPIDEEVLDTIAAPEVFDGLDVRDALAALPESLREPLLLQVLGGFNCAEIAWLVGTTEGAVMTRLTRARQALRRSLGPVQLEHVEKVGA